MESKFRWSGLGLCAGRLSSIAPIKLAAPKQHKTPGNPSVGTEGCEGGRRSGTDSLKYTDLPEASELRPSHLMRANCELSRRKSIYLTTLQSARPVFSAIRLLPPGLAAGIQSAGSRGSVFIRFHAGMLPLNSGNPSAPAPPPRLQTLLRRLRNGRIYPWYGRSKIRFSIFWNPCAQTFKLVEQRTPTTEPGHI
jgi:hypothetical protein